MGIQASALEPAVPRAYAVMHGPRRPRRRIRRTPVDGQRRDRAALDAGDVVGGEQRHQHRLLAGVDDGLEVGVERAAGDRRGRLGAWPRGARRPSAAARNSSPRRWCAVEPVRARPSPTRVASRSQAPWSSGASVTTTPRHDPAGGGCACPGCPMPSSRSDHAPADREAVPLPEVREQHDADDVPVGQHARRRPDAALPAEAGHPRAGADRAQVRRRAGPGRGPGRGRAPQRRARRSRACGARR